METPKGVGMPAWAWATAAFLIPNLIGFILYFVFRGPLLRPCTSCGKPIRGGEAFAHTVDTRRAPVSDASHKMEDRMKRERALQVVLVVVGLLYSFWGYLLFDNPWHDK